jgi:hypothetical protein
VGHIIGSSSAFGKPETLGDRILSLSAGTSIFLRTRQVFNGWEDVSKQITAIVPTS